MQLELNLTKHSRSGKTPKKKRPQGEADICGLDWIKQSALPRDLEDPTKTVSLVDLFCGCGGLTLGVSEALRRAGQRLDIRFGLDASEQALAVYSHNFGLAAHQVIRQDVRDMLPGELGAPPVDVESEIQKKCTGVDIIVAGPPCQGHSNLNNITRRNDERNSLYLRVVRLVELVLPKVVIIENVPAVLRDRGNVVTRSQGFLDELGYHTQSIILNATAIGLPQLRKRHLLIAVKNKRVDLSPILCRSQQPFATLADYIKDIEHESANRNGLFYTASSMNSENAKRVQYMNERGLVDLPNEMRPSCHRDKNHSYVSMYGRLSWDKPAQTITGGFGSMGQGRFVHPSQPRVLTPHEAARIQGFPDFFQFGTVAQRTALHEMIGNAVPPKVSAVVIQTLLSANVI